ncbi:MAG: hypothetical protein ABI592_10155 [Acidobacteriota bacterium]
MRRLLLLLLLVGLALWLFRGHASVSGLVDRITKPLFSSKAVVNEEEQKRVVVDSVPVVHGDLETSVGMIHEGTDGWEVRRLLGPPDSSTEVERDGRHLVRWEYRRLQRFILLENNRVVSIAVR